MCGLAGFIDLHKENNIGECRQIAQAMASTLIHRGPDASGVWVDSDQHVALAHRRLSIIDLSDTAAQPMHSPSGRYTLSYNGEIYNYPALRHDLQKCGVFFRGHSDTEVVLGAIEYWGVKIALQHFVGMFAFALWDRKQAELSLVRDRMGEKPLYYSWHGKSILFASELKAFCAYPGWRGDIDRNALAQYMRHNTISAPWSIYKGVRKLRPGHWLRISQDKTGVGEEIFRVSGNNCDWFACEQAYWSLDKICQNRETYSVDAMPEIVDELSRLLQQSVEGQMLADVPLGAFLSGGIDSSTIVAVMQSLSTRPVKTFSIGFAEPEYNEAPYAADIARHLGTDHTELMVTPEDAMAVIPQIASLYDEPFADSSQIPTWLVSQLTRRQVTVALSGDGGDELFAGYDRYRWAQKISRMIHHFPLWIRKQLATLIQIPSVATLDRMSLPFQPVLGALGLDRHPGHKIHRLANMLGSSDQVDLYRTLVSHWEQLDQLVIGSDEYQNVFVEHPKCLGQLQEIEQYMLLDMLTYLPDDILTKVDRASMAHSLEVRVPLLDHRIVEFSWRIPMQVKQRNGQTKWPLREILRKYVPNELIDRPKMGFGVPLDHWLRGPLRDWVEALLDENVLRRQGYFDPAPIRARWQEHLSGQRNWQYHLWDVLMFQSWYEGQ